MLKLWFSVFSCEQTGDIRFPLHSVHLRNCSYFPVPLSKPLPVFHSLYRASLKHLSPVSLHVLSDCHMSKCLSLKWETGVSQKQDNIKTAELVWMIDRPFPQAAGCLVVSHSPFACSLTPES